MQVSEILLFAACHGTALFREARAEYGQAALYELFAFCFLVGAVLH